MPGVGSSDWWSLSRAATALTEAGSSCQDLPFRVQAWKWLTPPGLSAAREFDPGLLNLCQLFRCQGLSGLGPVGAFRRGPGKGRSVFLGNRRLRPIPVPSAFTVAAVRVRALLAGDLGSGAGPGSRSSR
jgi:hypothetical protein